MLDDILLEKITTLPTILSIREAADFFSVSRRTIKRLIRRGKMPAYKDDEGNWCILRNDLKQYCSKNSNL